MPGKRWRTWLLWVLGCALLIGVGFALHATLPAQPRFVLRGSHVRGSLSPDGKILTTGTLERNEEDAAMCVSLKAWDTVTRQERGEFFLGLSVPFNNPAGFRRFQSEPGFAIEDLVYSPDRRYCALLHENGLARSTRSPARRQAMANSRIRRTKERLSDDLMAKRRSGTCRRARNVAASNSGCSGGSRHR